jgi:hypothetical protein
MRPRGGKAAGGVGGDGLAVAVVAHGAAYRRLGLVEGGG